MYILDVMVGNYIDIDWKAFSLWIDGYSLEEAATNIRESNPTWDPTLLKSDLNDHYRMFEMLEPLLFQPKIFSQQLVWQLDSATQQKLISQYYDMDNAVARELLGRKLSSRLKKDLDEIGEKTGVSLKSCRRQFENIKRVFKEVEDMPGNFLVNIKSEFCLPDHLAEAYSVMVFVASHRFETCKKKLTSVTFHDFALVSRVMMVTWTLNGQDVDLDGEPAFDRDFLNSLRDLKVLVDREKELRTIICQRISSNKAITSRSAVELEQNFKTLNRNIISIAQTIHQNKEIKEIYVNVMDKLVDVFKQARVRLVDIEAFMAEYQAGVMTLFGQSHEQENNNSLANFDRFLRPLCVMVLTFSKSVKIT